MMELIKYGCFSAENAKEWMMMISNIGIKK